MKRLLALLALCFPLVAGATCPSFSADTLLRAADLNTAITTACMFGGMVDNSPIGSLTPSTGSFTALSASGTTTLRGMQTLDLGTGTLPAVPDARTTLHLGNVNAAGVTVNADMFSPSGDGGFLLYGRRANGTRLTPLAVQAGAGIVELAAGGYDGAAWSSTTHAGSFLISAYNLWTTGDHSTNMSLSLTAASSTVSSPFMTGDWQNGLVLNSTMIIGAAAPGATGALVLSNNSNTSNALLFSDTNTSGRVWAVGPGEGDHTVTDFNVYDITGTTIRFSVSTTGIKSTGTITGASASSLISSSVSLTNGAGSSAGTLTNAPAIGNPTKWIPINDNGTTRYIPAW